MKKDVILKKCPECPKTYNAFYHKKCPYCQERQMNPLG